MSHPEITELPRRITVGDHVEWIEPANGYPASAGWIMHYSFTNRFAVFDTEHAAIGDTHSLSIVTTDLEPGEYQYTKKVWDGGTDQFTIEKGRFTVEPDLSADTVGVDRRSYAEIALENIEAVLKGKASKDQTSYSLNGRALSRYSPAELNEWRASLKSEVRTERQAERRRAGGKSHANVKSRFSSAI